MTVAWHVLLHGGGTGHKVRGGSNESSWAAQQASSSPTTEVLPGSTRKGKHHRAARTTPDGMCGNIAASPASPTQHNMYNCQGVSVHHSCNAPCHPAGCCAHSTAALGHLQSRSMCPCQSHACLNNERTCPNWTSARGSNLSKLQGAWQKPLGHLRRATTGA